jgi:hypothetical protein
MSRHIAQDNGGDNAPVAPLAAKPTAPTRLEVHPAALAFPEMSSAELQELADDIKQNGLVHPIVRNGEDVVLDGRNRLKACEVAGVEPRFETYKGTNPVGFIVSVNLKRRHLNESQRALVAARLATLKLGDNQHTKGGSANLPTQAAMAAMMNISERSIRHATIVRDSGKPELIRDVEQGKVSVSAAAKHVKPQPKPRPLPKAEPAVTAAKRMIAAAYSDVYGADDMKSLAKALRNLIGLAERILEKTK